MTPDAAQGMVVGCLAATGAVAVGNAIVQGHPPTFRQLAGFALTTTGLATAAVVAPDLAASFSVLILTSAVFVYGTPLWDSIGGNQGWGKAPAPATQSATKTPTPAPGLVRV